MWKLSPSQSVLRSVHGNIFEDITNENYPKNLIIYFPSKYWRHENRASFKYYMLASNTFSPIYDHEHISPNTFVLFPSLKYYMRMMHLFHKLIHQGHRHSFWALSFWICEICPTGSRICHTCGLNTLREKDKSLVVSPCG